MTTESELFQHIICDCKAGHKIVAPIVGFRCPKCGAETNKYKDLKAENAELKEVGLALLEYIDAIPDDVDFKSAMPGIDREWVENVLGV